MRNIIFSILVVLPLTPVDAAQPAPDWPSEVRGFHVTSAGARKDALKEAVRLVTAYVHQLEPPLLDWEVTEEFVEKNLLDGPGSQGPAVKIGKSDEGRSWIYRLKPADHERFSQLNRQAVNARRLTERQALSEHRLLLAGWIFGGVLALLVLAMAYSRWHG